MPGLLDFSGRKRRFNMTIVGRVLSLSYGTDPGERSVWRFFLIPKFSNQEIICCPRGAENVARQGRRIFPPERNFTSTAREMTIVPEFSCCNIPGRVDYPVSQFHG